MKKTVIIGISGGIACYKMCEVVSGLVKLNYDVRVIMTSNATEFITPLTLETLSNNRVVVSMFDKNRGFDVEHISYAKMASCFLVAPATANVIGKIADGIADDMLTTTLMATTAPKIICPAMNTNMYNNVIFASNLKKLAELGYIILEPTEGRLACGDIGKGKLIDPSAIIASIDNLLTPKADFRGKHVLITAGGTREPIDGVRYIGNRSSGKMGVALANAVTSRGGSVTLVAANVSIPLPKDVELINVETTDQMFLACLEQYKKADYIIKAAAPSDYKVTNFSKEKLKSPTLTLHLEKNIDIAENLGKVKEHRKLIIFAAETSELFNNASEKIKKKNADLIIANDVTKEGAGFDVDTNIVTMIDAYGNVKSLEKTSKDNLSHIILDTILKI